MFALLLIVPATALALAGYFALYLSNRSEGSLKSLGKYLGIWAFALAVLLTIVSIVGVTMRLMHDGPRRDRGGFGMMHRYGPRPFDVPIPPPAQPQTPSVPETTPGTQTP